MLPDGKVVALTEEGRRAVLATVNQMADTALRCLAFARKSGSELGQLAAYNGGWGAAAAPPGAALARACSWEGGRSGA
jgi:hypothetical protein